MVQTGLVSMMLKLATGVLIGLMISTVTLAPGLPGNGVASYLQADSTERSTPAAVPFDVEVRLQERYLSDLARGGLRQTELGASMRGIRVDARPGDRLLVTGGFPVLGVSIPVWLVLLPKVERGKVALEVRSLQVAGFVFPPSAFTEVEDALNAQIDESIGSMAGDLEPISATTDHEQLIVRFGRDDPDLAVDD